MARETTSAEGWITCAPDAGTPRGIAHRWQYVCGECVSASEGPEVEQRTPYASERRAFTPAPGVECDACRRPARSVARWFPEGTAALVGELPPCAYCGEPIKTGRQYCEIRGGGARCTRVEGTEEADTYAATVEPTGAQLPEPVIFDCRWCGESRDGGGGFVTCPAMSDGRACEPRPRSWQPREGNDRPTLADVREEADESERLEDTLSAIVRLLKAEGIDCHAEGPPMYTVNTPAHCEDGAHWCIGTARDTWGGDVQTEDGTPSHTFDTDVPSTSRDADAIARAVLAALREYCRECGEELHSSTLEPTCYDCQRRERAALRSRGEA